ncbi:PQQ-dependent sugar dehydrogenase [Pontibacter roseus]|uniref:PQQ-dependent sugar dehydrogenase n=1 Tax=Pontibacter roseus TaxID=336989 RepID=UPI00038271D5|nr:PQQ-dependent sugar dehydrogenase [Pontibacter roseus]
MSLSTRILLPAVLLATMTFGCTNSPEDNTTQAEVETPQDCQPLETREASDPTQKPAFEGQTRACGIKSDVAFDVQVITKGLEKPWAVEPLPTGDLLVTEKPGRLRIISASGQVGNPITGVPKVDDRGQGGLLDVALSPDFSSDRTIYWSFTEPRKGGNGTSVARGVLSEDRSRVEQVRVIFQAQPTYDGTMHYGSRIAFDRDGMLLVTLGERSDIEIRPQAQHMDSHMGKVVRIAPDGSVPKDNPFVNEKGALPEIWSVGHRNVQAAAVDSEGRFWVVEMGPKGGDELNLVEKGKNYGWPLVTYGTEYSGQPIPNAVTQREGFVQPVYYWDPVIAPSGAQFYSGNAFPDWKGSLFVGALKEMRLVRLVLENGRVKGEEHLLTDRKQRIRDVKQGPDGALFLVTDQQNGELWKVAPRAQ